MTLRLALAFALAVGVFILWPGIDLGLARLFHDGERFPLAGSDLLEGVRQAIWFGSTIVALSALALWIAWLPLGRAARVPGRLWGWIAMLYLLGPGLLVNGVLKAYWGRARPADVLSDKAAFSRPFVFADECARNCSFVSGEASAAVALAIAVPALLWPGAGAVERRRIAVGFGLMAAVASMMRVVTGRHFLSDVIFAGFLTAFVALALWRLLDVRDARDRLCLPALRHDLHELRSMLSRRLGAP